MNSKETFKQEDSSLSPGLKKIIEIAEEIKQLEKMNCQNCEYKHFYSRFKEIADYVEEEAEKRLQSWIREGKVKVKSSSK